MLSPKAPRRSALCDENLLWLCRDKDFPNGLHTYLKVVKSIVSAISDEEITEHFQLAYKLGPEKYMKDIKIAQGEARAAAARQKVV
jgi:hypothetical protein